MNPPSTQRTTSNHTVNISGSDSPYDYHRNPPAQAQTRATSLPRTNEYGAVQIPRSESPYDYHPKKAALKRPDCPKSTKGTNASIATEEKQPEPSGIDSPATSHPAVPSFLGGDTDCFMDGFKTDDADRHLLIPPRRQFSVEDHKHLWYCQRNMVIDEAAKVNDPWGFSSGRNSRAVTPTPEPDILEQELSGDK